MIAVIMLVAPRAAGFTVSKTANGNTYRKSQDGDK